MGPGVPKPTTNTGIFLFSDFTIRIPWFHYDCSEMGFYFRADPSSPEDDGLWSDGYRVRVLKAGAYYNFILEVIIDGEWSLLTEDWPSVYAGDITDPDMVTVITCSGPYIYLSFAGMEIWEGMDDTFSSGQVGIFGGVGPSSNAIEPLYATLYT